jgi:hypothetical protein
MSLRIRRGTEAQRTSATFDLGEIVYATDTNKLYVGDGVNLGGKNILATSAGTGLVWNITTQRLDFNGSGTGIISVQADTNPTLGGNLNLNSRNITGTGSIAVTGTLSVTGLGANLNLNSRNITGTGNIDITGGITSTGTLSVSGLSANLNLNNRNITGTGNIDITGGITSTVTSGVAINAVSSSVTPAITATSVNSPAVYAVSSVNPAIRLAGITDGQFNNSRLEIDAFKGTVASKTNTVGGDSLGGLYVRGYYDSTYIVAAGIIASWNSGAQMTTAFPASTLLFFANGNANVSNTATFDGQTGIFNSPVAQTSVYSVATTVLPNAVTMGVGARAFVSDATVNTFATAYTGGGANKVPVYSDGAVWRIG